MGKIRNLFKKIGDIKGKLHGRMSMNNQDGVVTHIEPNILMCKVKWALEIITANKSSGGGCISDELLIFEILKDDVTKVPHSMCQQIWKTQQWSEDWKMSVFFLISKKG